MAKNLGALFSIIFDDLSNIFKYKVKAKKGYSVVEKERIVFGFKSTRGYHSQFQRN